MFGEANVRPIKNWLKTEDSGLLLTLGRLNGSFRLAFWDGVECPFDDGVGVSEGDGRDDVVAAVQSAV